MVIITPKHTDLTLAELEPTLDVLLKDAGVFKQGLPEIINRRIRDSK